ACGIFADDVRKLDDPSARPFLALSRGTHIVLEPAAMSSGDAVLVPKTSDGRVVFAIPWHGRLLVGTTDVPAGEPVADPQPTDTEMTFLLETLERYANVRLTTADIAASF